MGISVTCPNGHEFKVKDKYAGKKGLCPFCPGQVKVLVPDATSSDILSSAAFRAVREDRKPSGDSSVLDDNSDSHSNDSSASLLGSSVIRHNVKCQCGERVPMWYAKCPKCGTFLEH